MAFFKKYIGTKAFYRELFAVSIPIAIHMLLSALVNFLDSAMIGRWAVANIGSAEIGTSSIMIANRYYTSTYNVTIMFAVSCSVYIAQFMGAKRFDKIRHVFGVSIVLVGVLSAIFGIVGFIFAPEIIEFFATSNADGAEMIKYGTEYLRIVILTFVPLFVTTPIAFALRATRRTVVPLLATIGSAITNLLLNYIFIYVMNLGIKGAAIATIIARFVELSILLIHYYKVKPEYFGTFKEIFSFDLKTIKELFVYSLPIGFSQIITEGIAILIFFAYARIDAGNSVYITAVNASQRVVDLVAAIVGGMGTAASIMVGTRLGAGRVDEAKQNARWQIGYVLTFSLIASAVMMAAIPLTMLIYGFKVETQALLTVIMIIHALSLPFMFYSINVIFITRAGGFAKAPLLITNLPYLLIKIPLIVSFVFIWPQAFATNPFYGSLLTMIGLPNNFIIFIFMIDRFVEVIRMVIAVFIYKYAPWAKTITMKEDKLEVSPDGVSE